MNSASGSICVQAVWTPVVRSCGNVPESRITGLYANSLYNLKNHEAVHGSNTVNIPTECHSAAYLPNSVTEDI